VAIKPYAAVNNILKKAKERRKGERIEVNMVIIIF
jgi:hypothetical protein